MDFLAGQCVGLVKEIKPAAEIVAEVVEQAARVLAERVVKKSWKDQIEDIS